MNARLPPSPSHALAVAVPPRTARGAMAASLLLLLASVAAPAAPISVHPLEDPYRGGGRAAAAAPPAGAAAATAPSPAVGSPATAFAVSAVPAAMPREAAATAAVAAGAVVGAGAAPAPVDAALAYRIGLGDELNFRFINVPELSTVATVRSDGSVTLPLLGEWRVAGATLRELTLRVQAALAGRVKRPDLVINVQGSPPSQRVFIGGEVVKPGVQPLAGSLTVLQAVMGADGLKDTAAPREVAVLRTGADGAPQYLRVDLRALMAGEAGARDLALAPQDIVVVPRSGIANVGLWVDQYIRRVIPISFGLSYSIGRGTATP